MKNLIVALSSAAVFSMSAAVMAGDMQEVHVEGAGIYQEQWGIGTQDAIIGLIADDFKGKAKITVKHSHIVQIQEKNGKQTAKIGVIGCDCGDDSKKYY